MNQIVTIDEARQLYVAGDAAHDFDHIWRVTQMACHLARAEGADEDVVWTAALLHDVPVDAPIDAHKEGDHQQIRRAHHLAAADFARTFLQARKLPAAQVANVVHCIEAHRFRDQTVQPTTLEARCLYDADKLDSIGAIGVGRAFAYAGGHGSRLWTEPWRAAPPIEQRPTGADYTPVHEFVYKLQRILDTLHTPTAQQIGRERHRLMVDFFEQLDAEMRQIV